MNSKRTVSRSLLHILSGSSAIATLMIASLTPGAFAQSQSGFTYDGLNFVSYQANEYLNSASAATSIRATGANYTAVMATQYQPTSTSNTIAPETPSTPGYNSSLDPLSPTDAAVVSAIQSLQAKGLVVSMKPQVDSLDGQFRGNFAPTDPTAWFASYQTFILHYAQIAVQNNVGMLVIGTEFKSLSGSAYKSNWETIITQLRTQYPSLTLTYAANATGSGDEFTSVSFWADLDIIGVDGYFPLTNQIDPPLSALVSAWTNNKSGFNIVSALKNLQSAYPTKPLIFTEIGYVSVPGTNETPYASLNGTYDPTEQQDCYEAFFEVFSAQSAWMKGVFWWDWSVSAPTANDTGYSTQNKPAGTITLPKWYGSTTPGFTIAPANSTLPIGAGLSAADVISVTAQGGFSGGVTLAVSGLPSGVTGSFANSTVAGSQVLTLTASSSAAAGPIAITVTGTSAAITATTSIALTVNVLPGFTLVAAPATLSIVQAGSATSTITVTSLGGFIGTPALAATGLPAGVTASFAAGTVAGTQVLTLTASGTAAIGGPSTITITGTSGALSTATSVSLSVIATAGFALSGNDITLHRGATSLNSSVISVSPTSNFSGAVALKCAVTPAAASDPPTCTMSPATVSLSGTAAQTSTLTISTSAATLAENRGARFFVTSAAGSVLAFALFFGAPRRRRIWPGLIMMLLSIGVALSLAGCGSSPANTPNADPGTSVGTYTVTVTGTSGATIATGTIQLTVQ